MAGFLVGWIFLWLVFWRAGFLYGWFFGELVFDDQVFGFSYLVFNLFLFFSNIQRDFPRFASLRVEIPRVELLLANGIRVQNIASMLGMNPCAEHCLHARNESVHRTLPPCIE